MGLAFIYTWSQENRNKPVTIYFFTIKAQWLPYGIIAYHFIGGGHHSALLLVSVSSSPPRWQHKTLLIEYHQKAAAVFAAHLYEFLTKLWARFANGRNI